MIPEFGAPAKVGAQGMFQDCNWIPACAGMTAIPYSGDGRGDNA
jgi:hypothetical protein